MGAGGTVTSPIVELDAAECRALLARQRLCVMATVSDGQPYAVPLYYGFDGETLYLGVAEGRKTRALDSDPAVCIVVSEPLEGAAWRSVMIAGRVAAITDPAERARAMEVMIRHNRRLRGEPEGGDDASPPPRRPAGGRMLRVFDPVITGRARL